MFANAGNTAERARRYNGLDVEPLYHPPRLAARLHGGAGRRLRPVGRPARERSSASTSRSAPWPTRRRAAVADGRRHRHERQALEALAARSASAPACAFLGEVDDDEIVALYAGALGVIFPPYDEDYGYVTLEAFLSRQTRRHHDRRRRPERVRGGRRERLGDARPIPAALGEAIGALDGRSRAGRRASATPATSGRARLPGPA